MQVQENQMLMAESKMSITTSGDHMPKDLESSPANVVKTSKQKSLIKT